MPNGCGSFDRKGREGKIGREERIFLKILSCGGENFTI